MTLGSPLLTVSVVPIHYSETLCAAMVAPGVKKSERIIRLAAFRW